MSSSEIRINDHRRNFLEKIKAVWRPLRLHVIHNICLLLSFFWQTKDSGIESDETVYFGFYFPLSTFGQSDGDGGDVRCVLAVTQLISQAKKIGWLCVIARNQSFTLAASAIHSVYMHALHCKTISHCFSGSAWPFHQFLLYSSISKLFFYCFR